MKAAKEFTVPHKFDGKPVLVTGGTKGIGQAVTARLREAGARVLIDHAPSTPSYGVSLWFGTALIAVGVVVNHSSAWRHVRLVRELNEGSQHVLVLVPKPLRQPYSWRWSGSRWRSTSLRTRFSEYSFPRYRGENYATGNKHDGT